MDILDKINSPEELKKISKKELPELCREIRRYLLESVSETGGHLSSNLGVVELTVALHYVFDSPEDKIIWDVSHQCYTHKILTGRKKEFSALRKFNGLSGFTKRGESIHDIFGAGHSSTSISAAVGIAAANMISGRNDYTIAVIGDGSFTGGLAYEALNNCKDKKRLIVILNDNGMSISKNVGLVADYFAEIRSSGNYFRLKRRTVRILEHIPLINKFMIKIIRGLKRILRRKLYKSTFFEELGFDFLGPVDGHNLDNLQAVLEEAKTREKPVFIYVKTIKGKGYPQAEDRSDTHHSVGKFDAGIGYICGSEQTFSTVLGKKLTEIAAHNERVCAITAAMTEGCGLSDFKAAYPDRFFDVGIAEEHAVVFAGGLAVMGYVPVFVCYSSFLQRAYDQIIHDVALQGLPVIICIDRAGLVGGDGPTHHGIFDTAFLNHIPGVTVYSPSTYRELEDTLEDTVKNIKSPVFIRYPRGAEQVTEYPANDADAEYIILSYGRMLNAAAELCRLLQAGGRTAGVTGFNKIKPIDIPDIGVSCKHIICIEEGMKTGGIFEHMLSELDTSAKKSVYAFDDRFIPQGDAAILLDMYGLSARKIYEDII